MHRLLIKITTAVTAKDEDDPYHTLKPNKELNYE